ncbi:DUF4132 domain-containing protein [Catenuloplanes sp. NPDC051500]|uniref:DUF4132 domain-containing protein n=1 Tax=Catenuloplanes sp. NPDC051500 TaxID=3363959 RepID=UPI00379A4A09
MENVMEPLNGWRRTHRLRRGGWFTDPPAKIDRRRTATLTAELLAARRDQAVRILSHPETPQPLGEDAIVLLDALDGGTPTAMAMMVVAFSSGLSWNGDAALAHLADQIVVTRGVVFAAETAVELAALALTAHPSSYGNDTAVRPVTDQEYAADDTRLVWPDSDLPFSSRVRNRLAVASDEDYAAAEAILARYRGGGPPQRAMVTFLLPTREDWFDETMAWLVSAPISRWVRHRATHVMTSSVRTPGQLMLATGSIHNIGWGTPALSAALEGLGPALLPELLSVLDSEGWGSDGSRLVVSMIAIMPTDEAFTALLDRPGNRFVLPGLHEAASRFPRRAMRLLAEDGTAHAAELLRGHVARHPEIATTLLPDLSGAAAPRVRDLLAGTAVAEAPADRLPPLLTGPLPKKTTISAWVDAETLPRVELRDGAGALPAEAMHHLLLQLAAANPAVKDVIAPGDLAALGWTLFMRWRAADAPSKDGWALRSLTITGDDDTVRRLAPIIRAWPGEGGHARAVIGLDVLAGIGTDVALMHLHGISQRLKFRGLRERAAAKIGEVADRLGLTPDQLADRLVPDLGLDTDGTLRLTDGQREFVVGFDAQLQPYVTGADGTRLKTVPRTATDAYARFAALKKDTRTLARDQLDRLEKAMVSGRRWTAAEFRAHLAGHPLLGHIVRRLIWGVYDGDVLTASFRVAEDRSFAGLDDSTLTVPDDAIIGVAHPVELGDATTAWAEVLADYEIAQPFGQLDRAVFRPAPADVEAVLDRPAPVHRLLALEKRGWRRTAPMDAGIQWGIFASLRGGGLVEIDLDPGISIGDPGDMGSQSLRKLRVTRDRVEVPLDRLHPVALSELIRDLTDMTTP